MDGRTDGAILICHPKFLRGHKKNYYFILINDLKSVLSRAVYLSGLKTKVEKSAP